jgi:hypothetical protein
VIGKASSARGVDVNMTESIPSAGLQVTVKGGMQFTPRLAMRVQAVIGGKNGAQLSELTGGKPMTMLMDGDTMYVNMGGTLSSMDGGKPWFEENLTKATGGLDMSKLTSGMNPLAQLQALIASGDLASVGTATIGAQATTHYRGTVSYAKLLADSGLAAKVGQHEAQQLRDYANQAHITSETVDLYVNHQNEAVREVVSSKTSMGQMRVQGDFSNWGTSVDVTPPPASQVAQLGSDGTVSGGSGSFAGLS